MERIFLLIAICICTISVNAQSTNNLCNKIAVKAFYLDSISKNHGNVNSGLLEKVNESLASNIEAYAKVTPNFLNLEETCLDSSLVIVNADNKKFKFIYWLNGEGGSIHNNNCIMFWKANGKLNSQTDFDESFLGIDIITITHLKQRNGDDLYFLIGATADGSCCTNTVFCYKVNSAGKLIRDIPVFKVREKMLKEITTDNCPGACSNNYDQDPHQLIYFSADKKTLYIADLQKKKNNEVYEDWKNRKFPYLIYKFDGTNYIYKKTK